MDEPTARTPQHGTPQDDDLATRWNTLLRRVSRTSTSTSTGSGTRTGTGGGTDPAPYARDLLARWDEPQRRYHDRAHLRAVLDRVEELAPHVSGDPGFSRDAVLLAAWFHDAVYRPDRSENEERSARLAERALPEAGVPDALTAETARLVRLTVTHDPSPDDTNGAVLCDADLAVLAGSPEAYARYAADVREEYAFVPDPLFREGRANVLRQLLSHEHLFRTRYGRDNWEHTARRNLTTELELLR